MSAQDDQTSGIPRVAAQAPTQTAQAEPQSRISVTQAQAQTAQAETQAEFPAAQAPSQTTQAESQAATQAPSHAAQVEPQAQIPAAQAPLQAESDISIDDSIAIDDNIAIDDSNSAYSDELSTYTASLSSSVLNFPMENGRRYHAFREGTYYIPNDEIEQDRMDIHHEVMVKACGGKLHMAPLTNPGRILDIGTGTGIWAIEMGDLYPDAEVIGNDFSPVQPNLVPRNVKFEVDDVEAPWAHPTKFDYIHARFMAGSIADWPKLVQACYDNLNPGGIAEIQDGDFQIYSEDGSMHGTWFEKWATDFEKSAREGGRTIAPGPHLEEWFRAAGFENIHAEKIKIPVGLWAKDKHLKEIGAFNIVQLKEGIEGFTLRLFTRVLGWAPEEVQVLLSKVRQDLDNKNIHGQNDLWIVYGYKPRV